MLRVTQVQQDLERLRPGRNPALLLRARNARVSRARAALEASAAAVPIDESGVPSSPDSLLPHPHRIESASIANAWESPAAMLSTRASSGSSEGAGGLRPAGPSPIPTRCRSLFSARAPLRVDTIRHRRSRAARGEHARAGCDRPRPSPARYGRNPMSREASARVSGVLTGGAAVHRGLGCRGRSGSHRRAGRDVRVEAVRPRGSRAARGYALDGARLTWRDSPGFMTAAAQGHGRLPGAALRGIGPPATVGPTLQKPGAAQPAARSPQPAARSPKPAARSPKPEARSPKPS